jgi:hypothetical protein
MGCTEKNNASVEKQDGALTGVRRACCVVIKASPMVRLDEGAVSSFCYDFFMDAISYYLALEQLPCQQHHCHLELVCYLKRKCLAVEVYGLSFMVLGQTARSSNQDDSSMNLYHGITIAFLLVGGKDL